MKKRPFPRFLRKGRCYAHLTKFRKGLPSSCPRGFPARRSHRLPSAPQRRAFPPARALAASSAVPVDSACPSAFSAALASDPFWGLGRFSFRVRAAAHVRDDRCASGAVPVFCPSPPAARRRIKLSPAVPARPASPPPGGACAPPGRDAGSRQSDIRAVQTNRPPQCARAPSPQAH